MRKIEITENLDLPIDRVWGLFVDLDSYPKYFKYVKWVYYSEKVRLGSVWYDFATFVVPILVKHKTTVFEENKKIGFDISLPFNGYIRERVDLSEDKTKTKLHGVIVFDFKNPILDRLFGSRFEKRLNESMYLALIKLKKQKRV